MTGLDPDDWEAFRTLAHRMLDDSLDHIAGRRDQPVWQADAGCRARRLRRAAPPRPRRARGRLRRLPAHGRAVLDGQRPPPVLGLVHGRRATRSATSPTCWPACSTPTSVAPTTPRCSSSSRWCAGAPRPPATPQRQRPARHRRLRGEPRGARRGPNRADRAGGARERHPRRAAFAVYASSEVHSCHRKSVELLGPRRVVAAHRAGARRLHDGRRRPRGRRHRRPRRGHRAAGRRRLRSARSTPARSTTCRPSPTSPSARASGCTSTARSAASWR